MRAAKTRGGRTYNGRASEKFSDGNNFYPKSENVLVQLRIHVKRSTSSTTVSFVKRMTDRRKVRNRRFVFTTPLNTFRIRSTSFRVPSSGYQMYRHDGAERDDASIDSRT